MEPKMTRQLTMQQAVLEAISEEMRRDPTVFMMGQTVNEGDDWCNPGISTLVREFGSDRLRPTGLIERFEAGAGVGAALAGARPIIDLVTGAFSTLAHDEIFAKAGIWCYEHGRNGGMSIPIVFRVPYSAYGTSGPEHSRAPLASYMHGPGLKVVVPSNQYDAKGLLKTAIRDDNPVIFMEPGVAWGRPRFANMTVPEEEYLVPFGQAAVVRRGTDCTVAAVGFQVSMALEAADLLAASDISLEVIDLRTLEPLDIGTVVESVRRTGHLVECDEDFIRCGIGAELGFQVQELAFDALKAPIARVAPRVPAPASPILNREVMPSAQKIVEAVAKTVSYKKLSSRGTAAV
jgi:acetoin:2,6-dichlorophenolindophenol oxidoreductase subunit beta